MELEGALKVGVPKSYEVAEGRNVGELCTIVHTIVLLKTKSLKKKKKKKKKIVEYGITFGALNISNILGKTIAVEFCDAEQILKNI